MQCSKTLSVISSTDSERTIPAMKLHQYFEFGPASQDLFSFCQIQLALDTVLCTGSICVGSLHNRSFLLTANMCWPFATLSTHILSFLSGNIFNLRYLKSSHEGLHQLEVSLYSLLYWKSSYIVFPLYWNNILTSCFTGSPHIWSFLWTGSICLLLALLEVLIYLVLPPYWKNTLTSCYAGSLHNRSFLSIGNVYWPFATWNPYNLSFLSIGNIF